MTNIINLLKSQVTELQDNQNKIIKYLDVLVNNLDQDTQNRFFNDIRNSSVSSDISQSNDHDITSLGNETSSSDNTSE